MKLTKSIVGVVVLVSISLACNLTAGPAETPTEVAQGSGTLVINSPANNAEVVVGNEVLVDSTASDPNNVARIDLQVNGAVVKSDTSPEAEGQANFQVLQSWVPDAPGTYTLTVLSYLADNTLSAQASITVMVREASDEDQATATPSVCTARVNTDLNRRTGPSIYHPIVDVLPLGTEVEVTGHNGDRSWWQTSGGWISAPYTTTSGDCSSVSTASFPSAPPTYTPTATETPTPTATLTPTATDEVTATPTDEPVDINFTAGYAGTWLCGTLGRVSFKITNTGSVDLESLQFRVEGPVGTYINGAMTNTPFYPVPPLPQPDCVQAGADALAPGAVKWINLVANSPGGGTDGRAILKMCSEDDLGGACKEITVDFTF